MKTDPIADVGRRYLALRESLEDEERAKAEHEQLVRRLLDEWVARHDRVPTHAEYDELTQPHELPWWTAFKIQKQRQAELEAAVELARGETDYERKH
jgi:hypothetical protein